MQTIKNKTITSANSVLLLRAVGVVDQWVRIEGFAADDAFTAGKGAMGETSMGVDGFQSGGWTPYETQFDIALQANSPSRAFFDTVINAQDRAQEAYVIEISLELPSIKKRYTASGFITEGDSATTGKKVLQPVSYSLKTVVNSREDI
jgi:hypothetical protein